ncbi:uncharacterized protein ACBT44_000075 isoform 1-T1 [Syngnathus typhle]
MKRERRVLKGSCHIRVRTRGRALSQIQGEFSNAGATDRVAVSQDSRRVLKYRRHRPCGGFSGFKASYLIQAPPTVWRFLGAHKGLPASTLLYKASRMLLSHLSDVEDAEEE